MSIETTQFESPMESNSDPPPSLPPLLAAESEPTQPVYRTKMIQFLGRNTPIILQKYNGPCPLLAICNILSLRNKINLGADSEVPQDTLLALVKNQFYVDKDDGVDKGKKWEKNVEDAIATLPKLSTGIDVNVKFRRIKDFEFTSELSIIFNVLHIPLYHGWIIDPQDRETADAIGSKSYDTLMRELVSLESRTVESEKGKLKEDTEDDTVDLAEKMDPVSSKGGMSFRQGELVQNFMENNASQLTKKGLSCLQAEVEDNELCVFFRNNHFNTMFKVNGDTIFMTGSFKEFKVEGNSNGTWDEQDALASTADYLANVKTEDQESSSFK